MALKQIEDVIQIKAWKSPTFGSGNEGVSIYSLSSGIIPRCKSSKGHIQTKKDEWFDLMFFFHLALEYKY